MKIKKKVEGVLKVSAKYFGSHISAVIPAKAGIQSY
jgi:hypothetical protein